jgi:hypothetical protein
VSCGLNHPSEKTNFGAVQLFRELAVKDWWPRHGCVVSGQGCQMVIFAYKKKSQNFGMCRYLMAFGTSLKYK